MLNYCNSIKTSVACRIWALCEDYRAVPRRVTCGVSVKSTKRDEKREDEKKKSRRRTLRR